MAIRLTVLSLAIVIVVGLLGNTGAIPPWCNSFASNCFYSSPSHRAISGIYSWRSWYFKDRRYSFTNDNVSPSPINHCMSYRYVPLSGQFTLSLTSLKSSFTRSCYRNGKWGALTRVSIFFSWSDRDRRFHFRCRWFGQNGSIKYKLGSCTEKTTSYKSHFAVDLPYNRVIVRIRSWFSNTDKDRRFRFRYCRVVPE